MPIKLIRISLIIGCISIIAPCKSMEVQQLSSQEELTEFDRETMSMAEDGHKSEGYWASCQNPEQDMYKGKYPFPKANKDPWPGKNAFLAKLAAIEKTVEEFDNGKEYFAFMSGKQGPPTCLLANNFLE